MSQPPDGSLYVLIDRRERLPHSFTPPDIATPPIETATNHRRDPKILWCSSMPDEGIGYIHDATPGAQVPELPFDVVTVEPKGLIEGPCQRDRVWPQREIASPRSIRVDVFVAQVELRVL
jgi:hypothetical protein